YSRSSLALLFSLARHHRYLPSFPTRRSSDLDIKSTFATEVIGDSLEIHSRRFGERAGGGSLVAPSAENIDCRQKQFSAGGVLAIDRKSTRLNSSHVKISYAVFCLKKKKKHNH